MPDLVHGLGGGQGRIAHADEVDELAIFLDGRRGGRPGPAVLVGEPRRERKRVAGIVHREVLNTLPEVTVGGHGAVSFMSWLERSFSTRTAYEDHAMYYH